MIIRGFLAFAVLSAVACAAITVHPDGPTPLQIETRWQVQLTEIPVFAYFPEETAQPAYSEDGRIVVSGGQGGDVVAASARTGNVLWRFHTKGKVRGAPSIVGRNVYIGSTDGRLHNLDLATGTSNWTAPFKTKGAITSKPSVSANLVVFQNDENRTYAVHRKNGTDAWYKGRPRPDFFTITGEGGVAIDNDVVFAGYDDGQLVAHALSDGTTLWSKSLTAGEKQFIDVDTQPVVRGDSVYAGCFNVGMYALGKKHGNIKWFHRASGVRTPAMGSQYLYVATGDREIHALDPESGAHKWTIRFGYGNLGAPLVDGSNLWVSTGDAAVLADAATGYVRARLSADDGQSATVATRNGWVHMVTNAGALVGARVR